MRRHKKLIAVICVAAVCLLGVVSFLAVSLTQKAFVPHLRSAARRALMDQFADFNCARTLTRSQVFAMFGPPSEVDVPKPGFAECCTWRDSFGLQPASRDYRLTLAFGSEGGVVAGGLYVDDEPQTR